MARKDYFIPRMFYRMLIPSVISSFGYALADMADALVLGRSLGEIGLASVSLCMPLFMLINLFAEGFAVGGSVLFSQRLGEGDADGARACFNRIWTATLFFGALLGIAVSAFTEPCLKLFGAEPTNGEIYSACYDYLKIIAIGAPAMMLNVVLAAFLRNDNNEKLASAGFLIGNVTDIALNLVTVSVLGMGTTGAGLSTFIGSLAAISVYLPGITGKRANALRICKLKADFGEVLGCFKTGFSTSVRYALQPVFFLVMNRLLMAKTGEGGVALFDLVYNISFFIIYLYKGIAEAAQPLISTFWGENSREDCRYVLKLAKTAALALGTAVAAVIVIGADEIAGFFGISDGLISAGGTALRIYCIGFAFLALNMLNEAYYQSKDMFLQPFLIVFMREFLVIVPCAVILVSSDFSMIWFMYPITEAISFFGFMIINRFIAKNEKGFDEARILRVTISDDDGDIKAALDKCEEFCGRWDAELGQEYAVTLVVEEICMSIIRNAMADTADGKIRVTLLALENGEFSLNILDNAVEFNPFSFKTRKIKTENDFDIDEISMTMIKNKTKKFMYRKCSGFNSLAVLI